MMGRIRRSLEFFFIRIGKRVRMIREILRRRVVIRLVEVVEKIGKGVRVDLFKGNENGG